MTRLVFTFNNRKADFESLEFVLGYTPSDTRACRYRNNPDDKRPLHTSLALKGT
jgi:hypothetical protein